MKFNKNTILKGIGGGIIFCAIFWAWNNFPNNKNIVNDEKQIIFNKSLDRDEAAKELLMMEINSSSYQKKQKSSKISSKKNIISIETIYDDNEIIDRFLNSNFSSSSFSFSSSSKPIIFETKNICENDKKLCEIVNFENGQDNKKLATIKTIFDRFDYDWQDYINSINIVKNENGRRGYATHSHIVINDFNVSDKEFWEVFTHELGHIIDLGIIKGQGQKDEKYTEFGNVIFAKNDPSINFYKLSRDGEKTRKAGAKSQDFVSGYGMSDPFEDWAESFNMYINHKNVFLAMTRSSPILKQKYDILDSQFSKNYFFEDNENAKKSQASPFRRPWDSTKMK